MATGMRDRLRRAASVAALVIAALSALLSYFPFHLERLIAPTLIGVREGHAYAAAVADSPRTLPFAAWIDLDPDSNEKPSASRLRLLEEGKPVGSPHSMHADIANKGGGLFSHWGKELIFSTSDNSDPRTNKRSYAASYAIAPPGWVAGMFLIVAGLTWPQPRRLISALRSRASLVLPIAALVAVIFHCAPIHLIHRIDTASINHWRGNAYIAPIPSCLGGTDGSSCVAVEPDSGEHADASRLILLENREALGAPHTLHTQIADKGEGGYSHWGRDLIFSTSDNSDPRSNGRTYAVRYALSPPAWLVYVLVGGAALALGSMTSFYARAAFWTGCALVGASLNGAFLYFLNGPTVSLDTLTYLNWSVVRPMGYGVLAHLHHFIFGSWKYLPITQLNLLLAGLFLLAYSVAKVSGRYFLGWLVVCLTLAASTMLLSASDVLTEAPFSAFMMAHVAFMILYFRNRRPSLALSAGVVLLAAIAIKSVGVVLVGPVLVLAAFAPQLRRTVLTLTLIPALVAWLIPSAYNLATYGTFETSFAGGLALGGHVSWAIHPHPGMPYMTEAKIVEDSVAPELLKRPAEFPSVLGYVDYTANEYNALLWMRMVPALEAHYASRPPEPCNWVGREQSCMHFLSLNRALLSLSRQAIASDPASYARHVMAHFLGLWRGAFPPISWWWIYEIRNLGDLQQTPYLRGMSAAIEPFVEGKSSKERASALLWLEEAPLKRFLDLITLRSPVEKVLTLPYRHPGWMLAIGLFCAFLIIRYSRLSIAALAVCYSSLCINAYLLGTALAQPSLGRYAAVSQGLIAAMVVLGAWLAISFGYRLVARTARRDTVSIHG